MADLTTDLALDVVAQSLEEYDSVIPQKQYPEIVIGDFLDIKAITDKGVAKNIYGVLDARGGLTDGIIGSKTTSLVTTDVSLEMAESKIVSWAKSTQWTLQELAEAQRLDINLDTTKLDVLLRNAHQTIQRNGFLGHEVEGLEGLLNSSRVSLSSVTTTKSVAEMTPEEALAFFTELFLAGLEQTGGASMPSDLAIDSFDLARLGAKGAGFRSGDGMSVSTLSVLQDQLSTMAGHAVNIRAIPNKYAQDVKSKGKNRAVIYTRDPSVIEYPVMMPETINPQPFNLIAVQAGLYCRFGSVDVKDPEMVAYVDYPGKK